jgi:hypothetical protein
MIGSPLSMENLNCYPLVWPISLSLPLVMNDLIKSLNAGTSSIKEGMIFCEGSSSINNFINKGNVG